MGAVLTAKGREITVNRLRGVGTEPVHVGWGTGAGTAAAGDTDLFTPATEARVTGTSSVQTTSTTGDTYQVVGTITCSGASKTITNVGLFDAAGSGSPPAGGNLYMHADHGSQALAVGDAIQYTLKTQYQ